MERILVDIYGVALFIVLMGYLILLLFYDAFHMPEKDDKRRDEEQDS